MALLDESVLTRRGTMVAVSDGAEATECVFEEAAVDEGGVCDCDSWRCATATAAGE